MEVSKFTIFTKRDLVAIQSGLESALLAWADKWFVTTATLPSADVVANAYEARQTLNGSQSMGGSIERRSHNGGACQLVYSARTFHHLYFRITGDHVIMASQKDPFGAVGSAFLEQSLQDLLATILQDQSSADESASQTYHASALPTAQPSLPLHKGSGTVMAAITDQDITVYLYLSQNIARSLCGAPGVTKTGAKLASRKSLIGHGKLKIEVTAGEAELRLADLMELRPGNVIRLNMKPNQTFTLQAADTRQQICHAYLGKLDGNKAIELINQ